MEPLLLDLLKGPDAQPQQIREMIHILAQWEGPYHPDRDEEIDVRILWIVLISAETLCFSLAGVPYVYNELSSSFMQFLIESQEDRIDSCSARI